MKVLLIIVCISGVLESVDSKFGVDMAKPVSAETFECLLANNLTFAIVRIFQSNGKSDPNAPARIRNARMAGVPHISGYIVPCPQCGDPSAQVRAAMTNLQTQNAKIEQIWITVKDPDQWTSNKSFNTQFIRDMAAEIRSQRAFPAIQTSRMNWLEITDDTRSIDFKDLLLWNIQWDDRSDFDDFEPFGVWRMPAVKQYQEPSLICGIEVNKDWDPLEIEVWRLSAMVWSRIKM